MMKSRQIWLTEHVVKGYWVSMERPELHLDGLDGQVYYVADDEYYVSLTAIKKLLDLELDLDRNQRARVTIVYSVEVFDENMNEQILT